MKGRYFGSRAAGRYYRFRDTKEIFVPQGCECAGAMFCQGNSASTPLVYGLSAKADAATQDVSFRVKYPTDVRAPNLVAIPCEETFLNADSPGTSAHKKRLGSSTKFRGCHKLEEELYLRDLVNYDPKDGPGSLGDIADDSPIRAPDEFDDWDQAREPRYNPELRERDRFLEALRFSGEAFSDSTALIRSITGGEGEEDARDPTGLLPDEAVTARLKRIERREAFARYMEHLTVKQRTAITKVYLENPEGLTQVEIATRLKISLRSLRDRIRGGVAKLRDFFPNASIAPAEPKRERVERHHKEPPPPPGPIYRWQGATRPEHPEKFVITSSKPFPFGQPKLKAGLDPAIAKRALKREYEAKIRFATSFI